MKRRASPRHGLCSKLWPSIILLLIVLAPSALADVHQDSKHGFKITVPRGWTQVPVQLDERWIIGKYFSDKVDIYNTNSGRSRQFTSELRILAFPKDGKKAEVIPKEEAPSGASPLKKSEVPQKVFRDYKDFKQNTSAAGGFYFSEEKPSKVGEVNTICYEVKVERMTSAPQRIIAWTYQLEDAEIAVEYTVLEDNYSKHRGLITGSLRSFRTIDREQGHVGDHAVGAIEEFSMHFGLDELSPKERREARQHLEEITHQKAISNLPKGWRDRTVGRCLVLSHDCDEFAKEVGNQVTAVLDWLDQRLYYIGPEEYVRSPIVRVCKDRTERNQFLRGSEGWGGITIEIVTDARSGGQVDTRVNSRALEIWLQERDKELAWAMPFWFQYGLEDFFAKAEMKGRRLQFAEMEDLTKRWRSNARGADLIPGEVLFRTSSFKSGESYRAMLQSTLLVQWLMVGQGSKSSRTKRILADYLTNLSEVINRVKAEEKSASENENENEEQPKTEAEEEEYFRKQRNAWQERAKRISDETFEATFVGWDQDDWDSFNKMFQRSVD